MRHMHVSVGTHLQTKDTEQPSILLYGGKYTSKYGASKEE